MTSKGTILGSIVLLAIAVALVYSGFEIEKSTRSEFCSVCGRSVHSKTRTVGLLNGKKEFFCCPTCALTAHLQTGERVQITELTDFNTGARLSPGKAIIVSGSDVNECTTDHMLVGRDMQANPMEFDRCSPSIIAFAHRDEAEKFENEHGGTLMTFESISAAYRR